MPTSHRVQKINGIDCIEFNGQTYSLTGIQEQMFIPYLNLHYSLPQQERDEAIEQLLQLFILYLKLYHNLPQQKRSDNIERILRCAEGIILNKSIDYKEPDYQEPT